MKVLYLFNRVRKGSEEKIKSGEDHDGHFYGMYRLPKYGIEANYTELEDYIPRRTAHWLREHILNIYFAHLPLFLKMLRYDVVFTSTGFLSQLLKTFLHLKEPKWVMLDFGLDGMMGDVTSFKQKLLHYMTARADGIITISKKQELKMQALFPNLKEKIKFIHFGVDTEYFKPDPAVREEDFILSPGRDPGRDFKTLAEATKDLGMKVKITARPWNIQDLQPLPENFSHHDFSPKDLVEEYRKAKIFVLPLKLDSKVNNAMGCSTLVEAMAMRKAVIATRTETTESYIEDGVNGMLVPEKNPAALNEALEYLLQNPEKVKEMGRKAREFAEKYCEADIFAKNLAEYFKTL